MHILVMSPRVAPGLLSLAAWDVLRGAASVHAALDDPHVRAIKASGIDVDVADRAPSLEPQTAWIAPTGDAQWARRLADELVGGGRTDDRGGGAGSAPGDGVEIIFGSYDLPGSGLLDVVEVMDRLRRECPWTRQQTHTSLAPYVLEEAQEVHETLESGDSEHLREELGDLLMQVVFHAAIAAEGSVDDGAGWDVDDVAAGIAAKLMRRNPHVFAPETLDHVPTTPDEIDAQWQSIKRWERAQAPGPHGH